jgi:hypothetical protein
MTKYYCDVCKKEISISDVELDHSITKSTFCKKCFKEFVKSVNCVLNNMIKEKA